MDDSSTEYTQAVRAVLLGELGEALVGLYLYGSAATGPYLPGQSDIDMLAVVREPLGEARIRRLLDGAQAVPRPSVVKGLDLWVVPLDSAREPRAAPLFECWLLTTIGRELLGGPDHPGDARLPLIYAMCRDHGVTLAGPRPRRVFGPVSRAWLVEAMAVDLALPGAAGWYRVLNACRTLHFIERGALCGKLTGAAWARGRVADPELVDLAVQWRRHGSGPPLAPERVAAFVNPIAERLDGATAVEPVTTPAGDLVLPTGVGGTDPLVSCVLVAPPGEELLVLAVKRFLEQDWEARELLVLSPPGAAPTSALFPDERIHTVSIAPHEIGLWREWALHRARGAVLAAWDPATWYAPDRLTQQVHELLSTSTPRLVAPSLLVYDPAATSAGRLRDSELLERTTLCAWRDAWTATGTATRLGERPGIAALIEPGSDGRGDPVSPFELRSLVGEELQVYALAVAAGSRPADRRPSVSCLMPTYNRRRFAERAIGFFLAQDYADRELVILDDGEDAIGDLVPAGTPIRYHRLSERMTIGAKRELACQMAEGEVLVQWDDDDWYGPTRLRRQVAPLASGNAEITGIVRGYLFDLTTLLFWRGEPPLHQGNLHALIVAGTLAYTREAWQATTGYPDRSIGEEVALLQAVLDGGGRVAPTLSDNIYVWIRHAANSWRLGYDGQLGPRGWEPVAPPAFLPAEDMTFYRSLAGTDAAATARA